MSHGVRRLSDPCGDRLSVRRPGRGEKTQGTRRHDKACSTTPRRQVRATTVLDGAAEEKRSVSGAGRRTASKPRQRRAGRHPVVIGSCRGGLDGAQPSSTLPWHARRRRVTTAPQRRCSMTPCQQRPAVNGARPPQQGTIQGRDGGCASAQIAAGRA